MATDDLGNQRVAFEWGNFPMQPNNDRTDDVIFIPGENNSHTLRFIPPALGSGDSHAVNGTEWNQFPAFKGSRNYMVTAAEYLGGVLYEYTADHEIEEGQNVVVSNAGEFSFSYPRPVIYANKQKFRIEEELGVGPKLTGLRARVDVVDNNTTGNTLEGGDSFYWPSFGICYTNPKTKDGRWEDLIEYMRACGVNPNRLKEATFVGGEDKYDYNGGTYDSGVIFWDYIPADEIIYINWETGYVLTGKDFDGLVISSNPNWGNEVSINPESDLDLSFVAFTNDPNKNTSNWWY